MGIFYSRGKILFLFERGRHRSFDYFLFFPVIGPMELIKNIEQQAHNHADDTGKNHSRKLDAAKIQRNTGKPGNEHNRSQGLISRLTIIDLSVYEDT